MNIKEKLPGLVVAGFMILGVGILASKFIGGPENSSLVSVKVPTLSAAAQKGKLAFDANCAACHGANGSGGDKGPPLVHDIYNPGHHGDESFIVAVRTGVRGHHWKFGNMPKQPQVGPEDATAIIRYVRELQLANGIVFKAHRM
ncbi:MAG: cytochrome c [Proteobacteria bacterium]|nr:cytochrome c [Pseudomonadota bacterium]